MKKNKILYSCGVVTSILIIIAILIFLSVQKNRSKSIGQTAQLASKNEDDTTKLASISQDKNIDETINETDDFSEIEEQKNEENKPEKVSNEVQIDSKSNEIKENKVLEENKKTEQSNNIIKFVIPVEGEIVRNYAKDKLVYSDTLKEWVTHLGIDIKAQKTSIVKASSGRKSKCYKK